MFARSGQCLLHLHGRRFHHNLSAGQCERHHLQLAHPTRGSAGCLSGGALRRLLDWCLPRTERTGQDGAAGSPLRAGAAAGGALRSAAAAAARGRQRAAASPEPAHVCRSDRLSRWPRGWRQLDSARLYTVGAERCAATALLSPGPVSQWQREDPAWPPLLLQSCCVAGVGRAEVGAERLQPTAAPPRRRRRAAAVACQSACPRYRAYPADRPPADLGSVDRRRRLTVAADPGPGTARLPAAPGRHAPVQSCPVLPCPVLSAAVLSSPIASCPALSYPDLSPDEMALTFVSKLP